MFAFADVFHFLAHKLTSLRRGRLAFSLVLASAFSCFFFWHNIILSLLRNDAVALSIENRKDAQLGHRRYISQGGCSDTTHSDVGFRRFAQRLSMNRRDFTRSALFTRFMADHISAPRLEFKQDRSDSTSRGRERCSKIAWETTAVQNLVRYRRPGTYLARFKVNGKSV